MYIYFINENNIILFLQESLACVFYTRIMYKIDIIILYHRKNVMHIRTHSMHIVYNKILLLYCNK